MIKSLAFHTNSPACVGNDPTLHYNKLCSNHSPLDWLLSVVQPEPKDTGHPQQFIQFLFELMQFLYHTRW